MSVCGIVLFPLVGRLQRTIGRTPSANLEVPRAASRCFASGLREPTQDADDGHGFLAHPVLVARTLLRRRLAKVLEGRRCDREARLRCVLGLRRRGMATTRVCTAFQRQSEAAGGCGSAHNARILYELRGRGVLGCGERRRRVGEIGGSASPPVEPVDMGGARGHKEAGIFQVGACRR